MRTKLKDSNGERKRFRAQFIKVGKKVNYLGHSEDTILLKDVVDLADGKIVTDHLWFTYSKIFQSVNLTEGDFIEFDARVKEYKKGYVNRSLNINKSRKDYKLSHPTKVEIVKD